jgi:hypothetical protein
MILYRWLSASGIREIRDMSACCKIDTAMNWAGTYVLVVRNCMLVRLSGLLRKAISSCDRPV